MKKLIFVFYMACIILYNSNIIVAQPIKKISEQTAYYADGYHGGLYGAMESGSFKDIVNTLERYPRWKVNLEIEAPSWKLLKSRDPETFLRIKQYLSFPSEKARIEIVSSSFAQPYCWNIGGESNIRQLTMGLDELHKFFPDYNVKTYSVQEPCWTSSLPSILRSLGYTGAVLKDPSTAYAGYTRGINESTVSWTGPDGTSIPAVPRYECEELHSDAWRTECYAVKPEFVSKCYSNGITFPAGMTFQDVGWPAHPSVDSTGKFIYIPTNLKQWPNTNAFSGNHWWRNSEGLVDSHIKFITWGEYLHTIAPEPTKKWNFSQEDIQAGLPWGSAVLNNMAQKVHSAERQVLSAEKLSALAWPLYHYELPEQKLYYTWEQLLLSQHHDAWICAVADNPTDYWSSFATLKTSIATQLSKEICDDAKQTICDNFQMNTTGKSLSQWIVVINSLGFRRNEPVSVTASFNQGVKYIEIYDKNDKPVPCQVKPVRWYGDGSINSAEIIFIPSVPSLGYNFYRINTLSSVAIRTPVNPCSIKETSKGIFIIESDLYKITINAGKGGIFNSFFDKKSNREVVDNQNERAFNEYRGYFPQLKTWLSSKDSAVTVEVLENGPIRVKVLFKGKIGKYSFNTTLTLCKGQKYIEIRNKFFFEKDVLIGEPWKGGAPLKGDPRKPCYDSRWKLQAFFPSALKNKTLYKNAAYDVCKSNLDSTFFNTWRDIKHNIILDWVDVYDPESSYGLALFSDRTTGYSFGKNYPFAYTLAWSGFGLFGGYYPMNETLEFNYALYPHTGRWNDADISSENASWNEPLNAQIIINKESFKPLDFSFIETSDKHVEVSTLFIKDKSLYARLFNASDKSTDCRLTFGIPVKKTESAELDGKPIKEIEVIKNKTRTEIQLKFPPFGIQTIKIN